MQYYFFYAIPNVHRKSCYVSLCYIEHVLSTNCLDDRGGHLLKQELDDRHAQFSNLQVVYGIKGNKLIELESQFLVVLSDKPKPTDQEVRDYYNFVDTSINENMVTQSIGAFTLKDGKVTGKIIYIAESAFNSYYYNKPVTSIVQIKDQAGSTIKLKTNNLNFTSTERDETITINEGVGDNVKAVKIEF